MNLSHKKQVDSAVTRKDSQPIQFLLQY